jgi:MYXO-CTERM domain-containing protein
LLAASVPGLAWAGVVWKGDFETGTISQYSGAQRVSTDRLQVVQSPVVQGRYALKATVRQGDDPINSSGNRNELVYQGMEKEGSEYVYRWQVMFAPDFPSVRTWQVFTQWHHNGCCGSPPVEFFVYGEELRLTLTDSVTPWSARLVRGAWQDFIFRVKWSSDPSVGFVELWHNGQLVLPRYKHATMYPGDGIYLKLGLYRSDTVQPVGIVYHDGFVQATQLEDVLSLGPRPDAGTPAPDAGTPAPDAGTGSPSSPGESAPPLTPTFPQPDTGVSVPSFPDESSPHGCSSTGGSFWAVALLGLGGLLRRIRRR